MPYWLESDTFADDPVWEVLAEGNPDRLDALQAAYARLKAKASHLLTDGYLTDQTALRYCRGRRQLLDRLTVKVLERPPLVHRRGDECDCLGDTWIDGYQYRIHAFLKRNPSRREYNRNVAQRRDLEDARLKSMVYARDGGCCRYCRSGPLSPKAGRSKDRRKILHHDHVDPDEPAGVEGRNLVIACARCNEDKGHRTPDEADMVLLPEPTAEEIAGSRARGQQLFDRPPYPGPAVLAAPDGDHQPINAETAPEHGSEQKQNQKPITDPITDPTTDQNNDPTTSVHPNTDGQPINQRSDQQPGGSGSGRVGSRDVTSTPPWAGQPARTPEHPDIYHRRSRAPSPASPAPEYIWPPGSVPATRPDQQPQPPEEQA